MKTIILGIRLDAEQENDRDVVSLVQDVGYSHGL
jgi:hypothetical protein